jgi:hypothetical protein
MGRHGLMGRVSGGKGENLLHMEGDDGSTTM